LDALLVDDPTFDGHEPLGYHPERPERLRAARAAIRRAASRDAVHWSTVRAREATREELECVHDARFIDHLMTLRGEWGLLDPDTYFSPTSVDAALKAAGGLVAMVDAMIDGPLSSGVALLRPPGHHARPAKAMGFCLLNNVAIAAAHARKRGLSKIAIVDWDVHHGNGTQEMFYEDPSVLYVSMHQFPLYPGTGALLETGRGDGTGYTMNIPLHAGGGDGVYRSAFDRIVGPALESFAPDLVLVSAGFDAAARDPLAEMNVTGDGFAYMAKILGDQARRSAEGRIALVLEGGYDLVAVEDGLSRAIEGALLGEAPDVPREDSDQIDDAAKVAHRTWTTVDRGLVRVGQDQ
jgi:acetoin utilization deacetylase AcuC-like enzyme